MEPARRGFGEASTEGTTAEQDVLRHVHALFQQRVDGDDALLRLAGLRFAQMGMAAEVYATRRTSSSMSCSSCPPMRACLSST